MVILKNIYLKNDNSNAIMFLKFTESSNFGNYNLLYLKDNININGNIVVVTDNKYNLDFLQISYWSIFNLNGISVRNSDSNNNKDLSINNNNKFSISDTDNIKFNSNNISNNNKNNCINNKSKRFWHLYFDSQYSNKYRVINNIIYKKDMNNSNESEIEENYIEIIILLP